MKSKRSLFFIAIVLIIVGIILTLENLQFISGFSIHWPVFLLILGSGFLLLYYDRKSRDEVLVWLGTFILILGIFFYYLNFTSWYMLAELWPVFLGITGLSFLIVGIFTKKLIFTYLAIGVISLFLTFMMVFTISMKLWPMSFVIFGVCLLILEHIYKRYRI